MVPTSEPAVETAYRRPATLPECSTSGTVSRMAYGEQAPSRITGMATRASTPISEPTNAPADTESSALTETSKNGCETNGTTARRMAAAMTRRHRPRRWGWRSPSLPPSQ
jgi:hypothetical protein